MVMLMESDSGGGVEAMSTGQTRKPAVRVNYRFVGFLHLNPIFKKGLTTSFGHGPWLPAYHYQDGRYFSVFLNVIKLRG